jgi:hypothetical protein
LPKQREKKPTGRYNEVSFPTRHRHRGARLIRQAIEARAGWGKLTGKKWSAVCDTLGKAWGLSGRTLRNYTGKVLPPTTTWRIINAFRRYLSPDEAEAIETALIPPDVAAARKTYIELVAPRFDELIEGREDTIIPTDPAAKKAFEKFARVTAAFGAPPERIELGRVRVCVRLLAHPDLARLTPAARARLLARSYRDERELVYQELRAHRAMMPNATPPPPNQRYSHPTAHGRPAAEPDHQAAPNSVVAARTAGRVAAGSDARTLYQLAREPRRQRDAEIVAGVAREEIGRIHSRRDRRRSGR